MRRMANAALAIASTIFALALGEAVIGAFNLAPDYKFYPGPFVAHPAYDYGLRTNHRGNQGDVPVWTDERGMRVAALAGVAHARADRGAEQQRQVATPDNREGSRYKILMLGDSVPFGWGVRYEDTLAYLLEQSFRETEPGAVVLNASVPGYGPWNYYRYLLAHVDQLRPDLVILCLSANDYAEREWVANERGTLTKRGMEGIRTDLAEFLFNNSFLSRHFGTYRLIKDAARDYLYRRHDAAYSASVLELLISAAHAERATPSSWDGSFAYLGQMHALLRERHVGFHVLDVTENAEVGNYLAARYGTTSYVERDRVGNILPRDAHPNASGHRAIFQTLRRDLPVVPVPRQ